MWTDAVSPAVIPFPNTFNDIRRAVLLASFVNPEEYTADILLRPAVIPETFIGVALDNTPAMVKSIILFMIISVVSLLSVPVIFSKDWPIKVDIPALIADPACGPT